MRSTDLHNYPRLRLISLSIVILGGLSACQSNTLPVPKATIPAGVQPQASYAPPQPHVNVIDNGVVNNSFTWSRITATYAEQLTNLHSSFYAPPENIFFGQLEIGSMLNDAHRYAIMCMVDYVQTPCHSQAQLTLLEPVAANSVATIPLQIPIQAAGMHDLEVVVVGDPYRKVSKADLHTVAEVMNMPTMANVYVGDSARAFTVDAINPTQQPSLPDGGNLEFMASQIAELVEPRGIPVWLQEEVQAGKQFDFYLHFHSQAGFRRINAVMAFIDYAQAPIYVDQQAQLPLYIERHPGTWQSLHVTMQAPTKPGEYDLLFVNRTHAHERLEGTFSQVRFIFDPPFTLAQLVKLKVVN